MDVRKIKIDDFDYALPGERIALHPLEQRDACRLLVANRKGKITHSVFSRLPLFLRPETLIIANETRVIRARLEFTKETGAKIEIFLLEPLKPADYATNFASDSHCSWTCLIGNKKRWKEGALSMELQLEKNGVQKAVTLRAVRLPGDSDDGVAVEFAWDSVGFSFAEIIEAAGNIPIPPYLNRESEESDSTDYQTIYSHTEGSVAAPTAGLHFTSELIEELKRDGHEFATVTLHVGAGTFKPVKSAEIGEHPMHSEWISVGRKTLARIIDALENGRDILAVGTTSVRTLESLPYLGMQDQEVEGEVGVTQWMPYEEKYSKINTIGALKSLLRAMDKRKADNVQTRTSIMIAPGFRWRIVNRLITNFHQPKSTLLLLVGSFIDPQGYPAVKDAPWRAVYTEALAEGYRFLSYGDACLFSRGPQPVELPLSKSMAIRAATIYAVKSPEKLEEMDRLSLSNDSELYIKALRDTLSSAKDPEGKERCIYIGEGAAPLRFLLAFAASLPGANVRITCADGLKRRPLASLVDSLRSIGADIEWDDDPSTWHVSIHGKKLKGGKVKVDSSVTSQYVSALLLASLLWERPLELEGRPDVSLPYVEMTEKMLGGDLRIESDWSSAAFFYEYCFISGEKVKIEGLGLHSLQGDREVSKIFMGLGVETSYSTPPPMATLTLDKALTDWLRETDRQIVFNNMRFCPDLVPPLVVALCYRRIPFRIAKVGHLAYKESNRLEVLHRILHHIGYGVSVDGEDLIFDGEFKPMEEFPVIVDPCGDHRIAMAFYPLELMGMVSVEDKEVVCKSFPNFYAQFK